MLEHMETFEKLVEKTLDTLRELKNERDMLREELELTKEVLAEKEQEVRDAKQSQEHRIVELEEERSRTETRLQELLEKMRPLVEDGDGETEAEVHASESGTMFSGCEPAEPDAWNNTDRESDNSNEPEHDHGGGDDFQQGELINRF